jgi:hypothetical protein
VFKKVGFSNVKTLYSKKEEILIELPV